MSAYRPLPVGAVATLKGHWLFQSLAEHVQGLLGTSWHPPENIETLAGTPGRVKDAWYLWWFSAEVGGNGFNGYLGNGSASCREIQSVRNALENVGASTLLRMLEGGIPLAREYEASFWDEPESKQFSSLSSSTEWTSLEEMDETSMELASDPLSELVAQYLKTHPEGI